LFMMLSFCVVDCYTHAHIHEAVAHFGPQIGNSLSKSTTLTHARDQYPGKGGRRIERQCRSETFPAALPPGRPCGVVCEEADSRCQSGSSGARRVCTTTQACAFMPRPWVCPEKNNNAWTQYRQLRRLLHTLMIPVLAKQKRSGTFDCRFGPIPHFNLGGHSLASGKPCEIKDVFRSELCQNRATLK
jgi:hypothetical protein